MPLHLAPHAQYLSKITPCFPTNQIEPYPFSPLVALQTIVQKHVFEATLSSLDPNLSCWITY